MFKGCLGKLIALVLAALAVTIFVAGVGFTGFLFVKEQVSRQSKPTEVELKVRAEKLADFSDIPLGYYVTGAYDILGAKVVVAEYRKTDQKMIMVDSAWLMEFAKNDIEKGTLREKLEKVASKFKYDNLTVNSLTFDKFGTFKAMDQVIPYQKFNLSVSGKYKKDLIGFVGLVSNGTTGKNNLVISYTEFDDFSQRTAERFFQKVNFN